MESMMAMPRKGHIEQLFKNFTYLRIKHNCSMVFDPTDPDIDDSQFVCEDWLASTYGECR